MLELAKKYEDQISEALCNTWYDDKYKYFHCSSFHESFKLPDNDWDGRNFVSVDKNDNLIGYFCYELYRPTNMTCGFGAINFTDNKATFGKDLLTVIDDIFCKFNHQKLEFAVIVGNPIEKSYDKIVSKYGGSIVGVRHRHITLYDNQYYDDKLYEILREDYLKAKNN